MKKLKELIVKAKSGISTLAKVRLKENTDNDINCFKSS